MEKAAIRDPGSRSCPSPREETRMKSLMALALSLLPHVALASTGQATEARETLLISADGVRSVHWPLKLEANWINNPEAASGGPAQVPLYQVRIQVPESLQLSPVSDS